MCGRVSGPRSPRQLAVRAAADPGRSLTMPCGTGARTGTAADRAGAAEPGLGEGLWHPVDGGLARRGAARGPLVVLEVVVHDALEVVASATVVTVVVGGTRAAASTAVPAPASTHRVVRLLVAGAGRVPRGVAVNTWVGGVTEVGGAFIGQRPRLVVRG